MADLVDAVRENLQPIGPGHPFSAIDAMVFSQLSYLRMPSLVPRLREGTVDPLKGAVPLSALLRREDYPEMVGGMNYAQRVTELVRVCGESPRLRRVKVGAITEPAGPHDPRRFAAMTFLLPQEGSGRALVVAFRGTDSTFAGWYEDFRLLFITPPLPSQGRAERYLSRVAGPGCKVYLTGHSWGGNLAEYAAASSPAGLQKRICGVFSQDSPGFTREFIGSPGFQRIAPRLHRIVPADSIVGMLFDPGVEETVVSSSAHGVAQHFLTTWQFESSGEGGGPSLKLKTLNSVSRPSLFFGRVIDKWRRTVDPPTRKRLVDDLFTVLRATGFDNFSDMAANWSVSLHRASGAVHRLGPAERRMIGEVLEALVGVLIPRAGSPTHSRRSQAEPGGIVSKP